MADGERGLDDEEIVECWCGDRGTEDELFDPDLFEQTCGGNYVLYCECGGDNLCVCHHHGEVECPGCEDCLEEGALDWDEEEG